jgi:ferric-dicitrate binding protein FerR (iron transport regulator)
MGPSGDDDKLRVTIEAVNWIGRVEVEQPEAETVREFGSWVAASPEHIVSFIKQYRIELAMRHVRRERGRARQEREAAAARSAARRQRSGAWWKRFRF